MKQVSQNQNDSAVLAELPKPDFINDSCVTLTYSSAKTHKWLKRTYISSWTVQLLKHSAKEFNLL